MKCLWNTLWTVLLAVWQLSSHIEGRGYIETNFKEFLNYEGKRMDGKYCEDWGFFSWIWSKSSSECDHSFIICIGNATQMQRPSSEGAAGGDGTSDAETTQRVYIQGLLVRVLQDIVTQRRFVTNTAQAVESNVTAAEQVDRSRDFDNIGNDSSDSDDDEQVARDNDAAMSDFRYTNRPSALCNRIKHKHVKHRHTRRSVDRDKQVGHQIDIDQSTPITDTTCPSETNERQQSLGRRIVASFSSCCGRNRHI